jgi:cell division protein FtsL
MSAHPSRVRGARPRDRRRDLRVVRANKRDLLKRGRSRRIAPIYVVCAILAGATIFAVLLEQIVLAQTGFKMAQLRDEMAAAESENAKLVLKVAKLSSTERIERVAIEELGMVQPKSQDVRYIVAHVRSRESRLIAERRAPDLLHATGTAAAELGGLSP